MGAVQAARGDVAAAQISLARAVELDPTSHEASFALGALRCERLGRCAESLDLLQRAIALAPDSVRYEVAAGRAFLQVGRIREARQAFSTAVNLDPSSVEAHVGLGVSRAKLKMYVEAATALEQALALDPVHPAVRLQLASAYRRLGRSRDAEKQHTAHRRIEPHVAEIENLRTLAQPGRNPSAHFNLARLYARLGHDAGAVRHLRDGFVPPAGQRPRLAEPRQCPCPLGASQRGDFSVPPSPESQAELRLGVVQLRHGLRHRRLHRPKPRGL